MRYAQVVRDNGRVVADRVGWLDTFWLRLRGLLGRTALAPDEGALLVPCRSVHTVGMRMTIDAAYLAPDGHVLRTLTLPPNRFGPHVPAARGVLELPAGRLKEVGIEPGERLRVIAPARATAAFPTAGSSGGIGT